MTRDKKVDIQRSLSPTIFVVFGATGDLAQKKIFPALLDLYVKGYMPKRFRILGVANSTHTNESFRKFVCKTADHKKHNHKKQDILALSKFIHYQQGNFMDPDLYTNTAEQLIYLDNAIGACANKLFYLSVPPKFYEQILHELASSGLTTPCSEKVGWTRVLIEKPYGSDLESALKLDKLLAQLFKEKQIFRIDHYLEKETVQNILAFRFSNPLFEPLWNHKHISSIEISLLENFGVETRGVLYDKIGALRDVGENHLLQMLAYITMDNPGELDGDAIRKQRAKVLSNLRQIRKNEIDTRIIRGQYKGYRSIPNVSDRSTTETYIWLKTYLSTRRWQGVPFYLRSGKKLKETKDEITIHFKNKNNCLCSDNKNHSHYNKLTFKMGPNEGISLSLLVKKPGYEFETEEQKLEYTYTHPNPLGLPDAYEKLLFDAIRGDQTSFVSSEENEASWKFISPILKNWKSTKLFGYSKGSDGPIHH